MFSISAPEHGREVVVHDTMDVDSKMDEDKRCEDATKENNDERVGTTVELHFQTFALLSSIETTDDHDHGRH